MGVAICLAVAGLSLLLPSAPTTDPWGWIVWGREVVHLDLDTIVPGAPSWKPLPVLATAPLALAGGAAPMLWLFLARAGGVASLLLGYRVAAAPRGSRRGRAGHRRAAPQLELDEGIRARLHRAARAGAPARRRGRASRQAFRAGHRTRRPGGAHPARGLGPRDPLRAAPRAARRASPSGSRRGGRRGAGPLADPGLDRLRGPVPRQPGGPGPGRREGPRPDPRAVAGVGDRPAAADRRRPGRHRARPTCPGPSGAPDRGDGGGVVRASRDDDGRGVSRDGALLLPSRGPDRSDRRRGDRPGSGGAPQARRSRRDGGGPGPGGRTVHGGPGHRDVG